MFLRIAKRRTSWEGIDPVKIIAMEFVLSNGSGYDLNPSVYKINSRDEDTKRNEALRTHTEHIVSFLKPQAPKELASIDTYFSNLPLPKPTISTSLFQYTQQSHHEYKFSDYEQLHSFVELLITEKEERILEFTRSDIEQYIKQKVEIERDAEWISLSSSNPNVDLWTKKFRRN